MYEQKTVSVFRADLIVEDGMIVETKVADKIVHVHEMQLLNYLKATGIGVGLILNFGPQATFRRMFLSSPKKDRFLSGHDPTKSAVLL